MLHSIMLGAVMLSVIMLSVIMLIVVAPAKTIRGQSYKEFYPRNV